jgi:hypothetical protein
LAAAFDLRPCSRSSCGPDAASCFVDEPDSDLFLRFGRAGLSVLRSGSLVEPETTAESSAGFDSTTFLRGVPDFGVLAESAESAFDARDFVAASDGFPDFAVASAARSASVRALGGLPADDWSAVTVSVATFCLGRRCRGSRVSFAARGDLVFFASPSFAALLAA